MTATQNSMGLGNMRSVHTASRRRVPLTWMWLGALSADNDSRYLAGAGSLAELDRRTRILAEGRAPIQAEST